MALEKLDEESIKAFKFLGFMQVKTKSGKWLSYQSLLDYAIEISKEKSERRDKVKCKNCSEAVLEKSFKSFCSYKCRYEYLADSELNFPYQKKELIKQMRKNYIFLLNLKADECFYCRSKDNLQMDHVWPVKMGGVDSLTNIVQCCRTCNSIKADKVFKPELLDALWNKSFRQSCDNEQLLIEYKAFLESLRGTPLSLKEKVRVRQGGAL